MNNFRYFKDTFDLCEYIAEEYYGYGEDQRIGIIGGYEFIRQIMSFILAIVDDLMVENVELQSPEMDGYSGPYLISIDNGELWCEPLYKDERKNMCFFDDMYVFVTPEYYDEAKKSCLCENAEVYMTCVDGFYNGFYNLKLGEFKSFPEGTSIIRDENGNCNGFTYAKRDGNHTISIHYERPGITLDDIEKILANV